MNLNQIILINIGAIISSLGGIFLKKLSFLIIDKNITIEIINIILKNIYFWLGGLCLILPIVFWLYLLQTIKLTILQPIFSIVYIYTMIFSYIFLKEVPTIQRIIGVSIITIGVYIVGRS